MRNRVYSKIITSPVGELVMLASDNALSAVLFAKGKNKIKGRIELEDGSNHLVLLRTESQLNEYFAGKRKSFDLPLKPSGTVFQIKAWKQLQKIPYGKTISYGEQAKELGDAKKARAVGMANGCNPLSIVVPCHRVVAANGSLTGFGGGLKIKEYLLDLEKKFVA